MGAKQLIIFCLVVANFGFSQEIESSRLGYFQFTGSILPAIQLNQSVRNNYAGGHFEYRFAPDFSFRGDVISYTGSQTKSNYINDHTLVSSAFLRNFDRKNWTFYIGVGFGLSIFQLEEDLNKTGYQPTINVLSGVQFHANKFLYFYAETWLSHLQNPNTRSSFDQVLFSGGLGFQFPTRK